MRNIRKIFEVTENRQLTYKTFTMVLKGDTSYITGPGQFVNIAIPGKYLRRPISVCEYSDGMLRLLYDVVGEGTYELSQMKPGDKLDILTGLGNGFKIDDIKKPVLLGGGIGAAPLFQLCKDLVLHTLKPTVILGYNTSEDIPELTKWIADLGTDVYIATVDGSLGTRGFVTDVIREKNLSFDYFYACGPMPMLKALCLNIDKPGQVSIESRMGCGFGACVCCSVETKDGSKRICKEGPIFRKEELIWK
ncbi:MAG: dihydroorotate dehydrogenase electron transfer subunit [Muribaculaceae bacterium]|nr:dihydroorotate dehydrogenase electron transfer subunit [Muribaculaceae bacterium]